MAKKKGLLEEIFSKALYADDPNLYLVSYRDFGSIVEVTLLQFLEVSENFELIPPSRIVLISKKGQVLYRKFSDIK